MLRFIVGVVLMLLSMLGAILYEGGSPRGYMAPSTFMVELLVPLFATLAVWRLAEIGRAFRDAFSNEAGSPSRERSARIWEFAEKICYAAAVIVSLIAAVLVLARVNNPASELAGAVAVALTGPLYGVVLAIVCRILRARVQR